MAICRSVVKGGVAVVIGGREGRAEGKEVEEEVVGSMLAGQHDLGRAERLVVRVFGEGGIEMMEEGGGRRKKSIRRPRHSCRATLCSAESGLPVTLRWAHCFSRRA